MICHQEGPRRSGTVGNEWTHQFLVYADDVNVLGEKNTVKKIPEALLEARSKVGLEANTEKTNDMVVYRYQNVGGEKNRLHWFLRKCGKVHIFRNNNNRSKLYLGNTC